MMSSKRRRAIPKRSLQDRPLVKLSVHLISTYRSINDLYYTLNRKPPSSSSSSSSSSNVATTSTSSSKLSDDASEPVASSSKLQHKVEDDARSSSQLNRAPMLQAGIILNGKYSIIEPLGKGAFGFVVGALHLPTSREVAIKLIKNLPEFAMQARQEWETLKIVQQSDPNDRFGIVRVLESFQWQGYLCIVFEKLSMNLYELIQLTNFNGLPLEVVQRLARQIFVSLSHLYSLGLLHCDIKPENLLLCHPRKTFLKLIDFSSCIFKDRPGQHFPFYIQSRYYRAPEVLLQCPYGLPIDMWSVGCLLIELHTGEPLFPGQSQREMIQMIVATLGYPPPSMILRSKVSSKFFTHSSVGGYQLLPPIHPKLKKRSLSDVLAIERSGLRQRRNTPGHSLEAYKMFLDLISKLVLYKPEDRLTPMQALEHPFITIQHV